MHEVLVNRLGGLSLPRKSVVRLTDRPDMTLDVYRGRKTTIQYNQHNLNLVVAIAASFHSVFHEELVSSVPHQRHATDEISLQNNLSKLLTDRQQRMDYYPICYLGAFSSGKLIL